MKIKMLLAITGIVLSCTMSYAQKKEYKFGKIPPEEFELKAPKDDSTASAVKIFDVGNCYFEVNNSTSSFVYVFEKHVRYKIFNKNAYDLANYKIYLYRGNNGKKEELYGMDAATYNMVDGKMVVSKIAKDSKFSEEFNKEYTIKKFTLPNVKEGSVIEFKYTIKSDFIFNIRGWDFQTSVPTLHSEYNVKIPEYLTYKLNTNGYIPINRTKHENVNASYVQNVSSTAMYDQYILDNVPALREEAYITTLDDYRSSISFELQGTQFPNETVQNFTGNWPKIVGGLLEEANFGLFLNKNGAAKALLPSIINTEKDTLALTKLIYDYVKNNIKWNGNYSFYTTETNPKSVFDKKIGNSADINLCLISLLKEAKIEAHPLLVSTRDNGIHPGFPIISKFNNVLVHLVIGNKNIFLDATDRNHQMGMVAYQSLNHQGLSIDTKSVNARWVNTEPEFNNEKTFNYNLELDQENKLKGTIYQYSKGYAGLAIRERFRKKDNETEFLKDFKKNKTGLEISNYKIANLDNLDEVLTESMNVVIEDNVEEAGNLIYFMPLLYERTKENIFKHDERLFPVDFGHPIKENYRIVVKFPENYEIEKLPQSNTFKAPDNKGTFSISFLKEGNSLMVRSVIDIPRTFYTPEEYYDLKELFKFIVQKQSEQVVFKKKS